MTTCVSVPFKVAGQYTDENHCSSIGLLMNSFKDSLLRSNYVLWIVQGSGNKSE